MRTSSLSNAFSSVGKADHVASFMPSAEDRTFGGQAVDGVTSAFDSAISSSAPETAFSQATGRNHIESNQGLQQNTNNFVSGANSGANMNVETQGQGLKSDVQQSKASFVKDLQETQGQLAGMLQDEGLGLGLSKSAIATGFSSSVQSDAGRVVDLASGGVSEIYDMYRAMKGAGNDQKSEIAAQVNKVMQAQHEAGQQCVFTKEVLDEYQDKPQEFVQLLEDIMRPAEMHDEMKFFDGLEADIDYALDGHDQNRDIAVSNAAEEMGVSTADVAAGELSVQKAEEVTAALNDAKDWGIDLNAVEYGAKLPDVKKIDQVPYIYDVGVRDDAKADLAVAANEALDAIAARKQPVAEINNEPDPRLFQQPAQAFV